MCWTLKAASDCYGWSQTCSGFLITGRYLLWILLHFADKEIFTNLDKLCFSTPDKKTQFQMEHLSERHSQFLLEESLLYQNLRAIPRLQNTPAPSLCCLTTWLWEFILPQRMHPHEYMLKQLQCEAQQGAAKLFSPRRECHWSTGAVRRLPVMQLLNLLYPASQQSTQRLWSIWTKVFRKITETSKKFKWNQDWKRIKEELGRGLSSFWGFSWVLTCVEQESKQRSASLSSSFSHISLTSSLLASFAALSLCSPGGKSAWQTRYAGEKGFSLFVPQAPLLIIKKILH